VTRGAWVFLTAFGLGAVLVLLLLVRGCTEPPDDAVVQAERERADSIVAEEQRRTDRAEAAAASLADSATAANDRAADARARADALRKRIADLERRLAGVPLPPTEPGAPRPIVVDSLASCEERYQLRSAEALELRVALAECGQVGRLERARADTFAAATARLRVALVASDSARRVEIERPRPCRRSLLITSLPCSAWDVALVLTTLVVREAAF
jgi:hypothetical protein